MPVCGPERLFIPHNSLVEITEKLTLPNLKTVMIIFNQIFIIRVYREII